MARPARLERATCGFVVSISELPNLLKVRKYLKSLNVTFTNFQAFWQDLAHFRNFFSHKFSHRISSGHLNLIHLFKYHNQAILGFSCFLFFGDDSFKMLRWLFLLHCLKAFFCFSSLALSTDLEVSTSIRVSCPFFLTLRSGLTPLTVSGRSWFGRSAKTLYPFLKYSLATRLTSLSCSVLLFLS